MYIAGILVRNPLNRLQVGIAVMSGLIVHHLLGTIVDMGKVWVGIEELEAVEGLAQSVLIVEGVAFFNDLLFSGILFALLPTLYLVPRLYGKIEPLLGMKPRDNKVQIFIKRTNYAEISCNRSCISCYCNCDRIYVGIRY